MAHRTGVRSYAAEATTILAGESPDSPKIQHNVSQHANVIRYGVVAVWRIHACRRSTLQYRNPRIVETHHPSWEQSSVKSAD